MNAIRQGWACRPLLYAKCEIAQARTLGYIRALVNLLPLLRSSNRASTDRETLRVMTAARSRAGCPSRIPPCDTPSEVPIASDTIIFSARPFPANTILRAVNTMTG